jgi:DNA-binding transcriptional ArsR family regulator
MTGEGAVFAALADPTRRRLVRILSSDGPQSATRLAERLPISRQGVAKHLSALVAAGLASTERRGREVVYELTPEPFEQAAAWMEEIGAEWDRRLERLRRLLEDPRG